MTSVWWRTVLKLGVATAAVIFPAALHAQPPTLHAAIEAAYSTAPPGDPKAELKAIQALRDRAAADRGISVEDRAKIQVLYGVAIAHNSDFAGGAAEIARGVAMLDAAGQGRTALAAELLENQGTNQSLSGHPDAGLITLQRSLEIRQALFGSQSQQVGEVLGSLAYTANRLGHLQQSIDYYRQSFALTKPTETFRIARVANLSTLHSVLVKAGYREEALHVGEQLVGDARTYLPPGHRGIAISLLILASDLDQLGRYDEAEAIYRQGLTIALKNEGPEGFDTVTLSANLGRLLVRQGRETEGEAMLIQTASLFQKIPSSQPESAVNVWITLAKLSLEQGQASKAEERGLTALKLLDRMTIRAQFERLKLNNLVAQIRLVRGDYEGALQALDASSAYARSELSPSAEERCDNEMLHALALARLKRSDAALSEATTVADAMETAMLDASISAQRRREASLAYQINFVRFADIALEAKRPDLAFRAAQLSAFTEVAATSQAIAARAAAGTPEASRLARALQDAQERREHLVSERSFAIGKSHDEVQRLDQTLEASSAEIDTLDRRLAVVFPRYHELSRPRPISLDEGQAQLTRRQAVILPLLSDDRLIVMALTHRGAVYEVSEIDRGHVERTLTALRASLDEALSDEDGQRFDRTAAYDLGHRLLPSTLRRRLGVVEDLQIVGSGPMMAVPAGLLLLAPPKDGAALRDQDFLIKSYGVVIRPSITAAATGGIDAHRGFIGIGAPQLAPAEPSDHDGVAKVASFIRSGAHDLTSLKQLPDLPNAASELKSMAKALNLPNTTLILGADANLRQIQATPLDSYSVVAFATHGLINGDLRDLREPALVLTPPAQPSPDDDGLLTASRIAVLKLNADWVILSACNTGGGRSAGSAGLTGLARAFVQAGGRNLMISMWPVRDDVAKRLTVDTVRRHTRGLSQPQALRRSVLALMADRKLEDSDNPAIWAPFALVAQ